MSQVAQGFDSAVVTRNQLSEAVLSFLNHSEVSLWLVLVAEFSVFTA